MSNHSGSYLVAEVLAMLRRRQVFDLLGATQSREMVLEIVKRAQHQYDCNSGEILEEEGALLGICYGCLATGRPLADGLCQACRT